MAFEACVRIGGSLPTLTRPYGKTPHATRQPTKCAYGKNPRQAIASAFKKLGGDLAKRGGAFAG